MSPSIFYDESDEDEHEDISEYAWECGDVSAIYHLAFLAPGHGDVIWNSSECIAEHLLGSKRQGLLGSNVSWPPKSALEFGAGAALPSMVLLREGVEKLYITDKKVNDMTFDALELSVKKNCERWGIAESERTERVSVLPHTWGERIEQIEGDIDLLVASDCIYNPAYHVALLQSAINLISKRTGVFIVGYSFHGNVSPEKVLEFFSLAKSDPFGFEVVSEMKKEYEGQKGIGDKDSTRGTVYVKVLAFRDSELVERLRN